MGEAWVATLTEGPKAGLGVVQPHYVEHVAAGAMFIPPARGASTSLKITGGVSGTIRTGRQLGRTGGKIGTVLWYDGRQVAGQRIAAGGRFLDAGARVEVMGYLAEGDLKRSALSAFGPMGSVLLYNYMTNDSSKVEILDPYSQIAVPTNIRQMERIRSSGSAAQGWKPAPRSKRASGRKPSQIPAKQKKRMWRMGLRWCKKHQRYDKCSLRAR